MEEQKCLDKPKDLSGTSLPAPEGLVHCAQCSEDLGCIRDSLGTKQRWAPNLVSQLAD